VIPFPAEDRSDEDVVLLKDVAGQDGSKKFFGRNKIGRRRCAKSVREEIGNPGFVGVADDVGDAGECGEFFRDALGVAAGDDDAGSGVVSMKFANSVAGLGVGRRSDCAGIKDDDVGGFGATGQRAATFQKLSLDGCAVGLGGTAAELFDVEGGHEEIVYRQRFSVDSSRHPSRRYSCIGCGRVERFTNRCAIAKRR